MAKPSDPGRLIVVGALAGAHGVRGDVRVRSFTGDAEAIFDFEALLDEAGAPLLTASKFRPANDHFIVTPEKPRQKEEWDAMKGVKLYVSRADLPEADEDEFYVEDLVGMNATDAEGNSAGKVKSVQNFGAGDLLEIMPDMSGEPAYFVPFTLQDVPAVDFGTGTVTIKDPQIWADQSDPRKSKTD